MSSDTLIVQVADTRAQTAHAPFTIPIVNPFQIGATDPLPGATQGVAYSAPLLPLGATGAITWVYMATTGTNTWGFTGNNVTGTPTTAETDTLYILGFDSLGIPQSAIFHITVVSGGGGGTLSLLFPQSVPGGVGIQMQFTMQAYGPSLTLPINWLSASVGSIDSAGNWTFTPAATGNQLVTITFSDSGGHTGSGSFTCVIT